MASQIAAGGGGGEMLDPSVVLWGQGHGEEVAILVLASVVQRGDGSSWCHALPETGTLPSAGSFVECILSGTR